MTLKSSHKWIFLDSLEQDCAKFFPENFSIPISQLGKVKIQVADKKNKAVCF